MRYCLNYNYLEVVKSVEFLAKVSVLCRQEMSSKLCNVSLKVSLKATLSELFQLRCSSYSEIMLYCN